MPALKYYLPILLLLSFVEFSSAQTLPPLPNDCVNAITVCGDGSISSNAIGNGSADFNPNDICSGRETNSIWIKINISSTGTLGFNLKPQSPDLSVDYDFFVFGANKACGSLGQAIRCSTTNPLQAGLTTNMTGMNGSSIETSEGPGNDGDSFVKWLDVTAGEFYYIMIERHHGDSSFNIEWTGSATTGKSPFPPTPTAAKIKDDTICNNSGTNVFNLNNYSSSINSNINNTITFYSSESDAYDNINPIASNQTLSEEEKTIYSRVTNVNGCFDVTSFKISAYKNPTATNTTLVQCDLDNNSTDGITNFNLTQAENEITNGNSDILVYYYKSIADRNSDNYIINPNDFRTDKTIIYTKIVNKNGCNKFGEIKLEVTPTLASLNEIGPFYTCENDENNINPEGTFNLKDVKETYFKNLDIAFYSTRNDASLELNKINNDLITSTNKTIFVRIEDNNKCQEVKQFDLIVNKKPLVNLPDPLPKLCLNNPTARISAESGFDKYEWIKINNNGTETTIGNNQNIVITSTGNYKLVLTSIHYDTSGGIKNECSNSEVFTINASNIATFRPEPEINDIHSNNRVTVFVEGEGDYLYAIDNPSGPFQVSNIFEDVPKGFSTIYVQDKNGCGIVSKTISVIGYDKFFTPNNDMRNDYWKIYGINSSTQSKSLVFIYDRYGKLVKQLNPLSKGWDGTFNGTPLPASDYWFRVKLEDGRDFKGHFTLKR
ncbi:T9SS type B sorting domain-containing protein [Joostella sp.]|uniref:T9SS type B sorting domain-containing protein n=1 Tax=Joostella sp. TaxID=2231138 RepID=UPI003A94C9FD